MASDPLAPAAAAPATLGSATLAGDTATLGTSGAAALVAAGGTPPTTDPALEPASAPAGDPPVGNGVPAGSALPTDPPAAADPNVLTFKIPNTETNIAVELQRIPAEVRMDMLRKAVRDYVINSVNQVNVRHNKAMEPFNAYDAAMKADPLQTAVPKPTGDRPTVDLLTPAAAARERLYKGEVRKQGEPGERKAKVDPLTRMVTDAVLRELFTKKSAATPGYKWTDAVKEVGSNGIEYLDKLIAEKVAGGADAAALAKFKEDRYIKPAKMMLGQADNKNTKDQSIL